MSSLEQRLRVSNREPLQLSPYIAALDIGASKTTCFIARASQEMGPLRVAGIGTQTSRGVKNGLIVDLQAATAAISAAIEHAEGMANVAVSEVILSVSGFGLKTERVRGEISFPVSTIGDKECRRVVANAMSQTRHDGRYLLHNAPLYFKLDGQVVGNPIGMIGRKLEVMVTLVTIPLTNWNNLLLCVERTNRNIACAVAAPYSSALAALAEDELDNGALLIEIGARSTTAALFQNGNLAHVDAVPIGSDHITQDIAHCFETTIKAAEHLKIVHGSAIANLNDDEQLLDVPCFASDGSIINQRKSRSLLTGIVRPRVEETLELLRDRLIANGIEHSVYGRRIVITGGGAQLNGIRELAARVFESHVRVGRPQRYSGLADAVSGTAFSSCAGLLRWGIKKPVDYANMSTKGQPENPVFKAASWLKELFW